MNKKEILCYSFIIIYLGLLLYFIIALFFILNGFPINELLIFFNEINENLDIESVNNIILRINDNFDYFYYTAQNVNIQLDNFTKSWNIRTKIVNDITLKIKNIKFDNSSLLIANVPYFLNKNYNNESVFFTTWNLNDHLKLAEPLTIKSWPICYRILSDRSFYPNHNIINKIDKISSDINVFYYEYEEDNESSKFEYLGNKSGKTYLINSSYWKFGRYHSKSKRSSG